MASPTNASTSSLPTPPRILVADINQTIQPNLQTFRHEMGFTETELQLLIASNPFVLVSLSVMPRLEFWQKFIRNNNNEYLVLFFRRNRNLISLDIASGIEPKTSLLKESGLSETNIINALKRSRGLISWSCESIETLMKRAKELVADPQSPMFVHGLTALGKVSKRSFEAKIEFFKGFGWSEEEILAALKKTPYFIALSKDNIREKMEFLVGRAGCKQSDIIVTPVASNA